MGPWEEQYLLQIGESITVSVGKDSSVLPSTGTLQLQDVLTVLLIQRALTGCLILVQIYFKLRSRGKEDLVRPCQTFVPETV